MKLDNGCEVCHTLTITKLVIYYYDTTKAI